MDRGGIDIMVNKSVAEGEELVRESPMGLLEVKSQKDVIVVYLKSREVTESMR